MNFYYRLPKDSLYDSHLNSSLLTYEKISIDKPIELFLSQKLHHKITIPTVNLERVKL
jgi:hypothetical protein